MGPAHELGLTKRALYLRCGGMVPYYLHMRPHSVFAIRFRLSFGTDARRTVGGGRAELLLESKAIVEHFLALCVSGLMTVYIVSFASTGS